MAPKVTLNLVLRNVIQAKVVIHVKKHIIPEPKVAEQNSLLLFPQLSHSCTDVIKILLAGQFCNGQDQSCSGLDWIRCSLVIEVPVCVGEGGSQPCIMAADVCVSVMDSVVDFIVPSTEVVKLSEACSTVSRFSFLCAANAVSNTLELAKTGHQPQTSLSPWSFRAWKWFGTGVEATVTCPTAISKTSQTFGTPLQRRHATALGKDPYLCGC